MRKYVLTLLALCALVISSCKTETNEKHNHKKHEEKHVKHSLKDPKEKSQKEYMCPMDCEKGKTYEKEGKCPVCKMKLVDKEKLDKKEK